MKKEKFQMETTEQIRDQFKLGEWAMSMDLSDTYHHVPIHRNSGFPATGITGRFSNRTTSVVSVTQTAEIITMSPESGGVLSSYLEILYKSHSDKEFSEGATK